MSDSDPPTSSDPLPSYPMPDENGQFMDAPELHDPSRPSWPEKVRLVSGPDPSLATSSKTPIPSGRKGSPMSRPSDSSPPAVLPTEPPPPPPSKLRRPPWWLWTLVVLAVMGIAAYLALRS